MSDDPRQHQFYAKNCHYSAYTVRNQSLVCDPCRDDESRRAAGLEVQPDPVHNDNPSSHDLVIDLMQKRKAFGLEKYATLLQAGNGRDSLSDLIDELGDAIVYAVTERSERDQLAEKHRMELASAWADGHTKGWTMAMERDESPMANPYLIEGEVEEVRKTMEEAKPSDFVQVLEPPKPELPQHLRSMVQQGAITEQQAHEWNGEYQANPYGYKPKGEQRTSDK